MDKEILLEKEHLESVLNELEKITFIEEEIYANLPKRIGYDPRMLSNLMGMSAIKLQNLKKAVDKPYFARIDFKEDGEEKYKNHYIGKVGFFDENYEILVTDWRAPVSSVYYDCNLGMVSYDAPIGKIKGDLKLKRQIIIEDGILKEIFDVDSVSDDELLKPYLGASADNRLKNIVASIQKEQNEIIRAILHKNVIVQGVAGSGKTTVALHRIAYLIYNYSKKFKPSQFIVIGPNKFFIKYISNVLPDLDVGNVHQSTFSELAKEYLNENFEIKDISFDMVNILNSGNIDKVPGYKLSMKYKYDIDKFLKDFEERLIPEEGLVLNGYTVFTKDQILDNYNSINQEYSISSRLSLTIEKLQKSLQNNESEVYKKIGEFFKGLSLVASEKDKEELFSKEWQVKQEFKTFFVKQLKKMLSVKSKKALAVYKEFVLKCEKYVNDLEVSKSILNITSKSFTKKIFEYDDIPAIMYIKMSLHGIEDYKEFVHAVVDESQDFGQFNFYVLKNLLSNSTFSIFGDITQGIYSYKAISNWEEVNCQIFGEKCEMMELKKSYRTTVEIMLAANLVSKHLKLGEGVPVIRHGEEVKISKIADKDKSKYITHQIQKSLNEGMKSIAVICKNPDESIEIYNHLKTNFESLELVVEDNEDYNGGICVLTSHLAKGLEFDSVIVNNVDESNYNSSSELDMKLLYVAMTRALHKLELLYDKEVTLPLK